MLQKQATGKNVLKLFSEIRSNSDHATICVTVIPNCNRFLPPIAESQLNPNEVSFKRDERRKTLFQGKVFIFLSPKQVSWKINCFSIHYSWYKVIKQSHFRISRNAFFQFKKLSMAVELAGGTPMLMEEGTGNLNPHMWILCRIV